MTELSRPWAGTVTGDAGPYSDQHWTDIWDALFAREGADVGVLQGVLSELAVTGAVSPVSVAAGAAMVNGTWYRSSGAVTVAVPTPAVSTRIDRIVLRKSWAAQTVRITRIAGVEGGGAPALVQSDGITWDIPLAQASITTGGAITLTNQRVFTKFATQVIAAMINSESASAGQLLQADGSGAAAFATISSIPANLIAHTTNTSAPSGWTEWVTGRGRTTIGTPSGGTHGGTVATALTNLQDYGPHTHSGPSHTHTGPSHQHSETVGIRSGQADISWPGSGAPYGSGTAFTAVRYTAGTVFSESDAGLLVQAAGTGATGADGTGATGSGGLSVPFVQQLGIIKS